MQLVTEWDGAISIFITATFDKQTATREVLAFEWNQYFRIIFWWRKQQDCTELKWRLAQTNTFGLISPLEYSGNTEASPGGHMGSLGERNSKPTPSASKNMWYKTHKHSLGGGQSQIHLNTLCTNVICKDGTRGTRHRDQRTSDAHKTMRAQNITRWAATMLKSVLLLELRCRSPSCYIIRIRAPVSTMSKDLQGPMLSLQSNVSDLDHVGSAQSNGGVWASTASQYPVLCAVKTSAKNKAAALWEEAYWAMSRLQSVHTGR